MSYKVYSPFHSMRNVLVGFAALLSCFAICLTGVSTTFAASHPNDPLVIVDADITSLSGPCTEIFGSNTGMADASIVRIACPAGTIRQMLVVHRSQAFAQHEPYVLLPPAQASAIEKQRAWQQFQMLVSQETQAHQRKLAHIVLHPATACGQNGYDDLIWSVNGDSFYSTITFYKTQDCKAVSFDTAELTEESHNPNKNLDWYWPFDKYASSTYDVPGCPDITYYIYRSHGIGQTDAPGYYYENWIGSWSACDWWLFPSYRWDNIGPIN